MSLHLIYPDWPLTEVVAAYTTTRGGGVSQAPYDDFNLALHVKDNNKHVERNRRRLQEEILLDTQVKWLKQTHSNIVVNAANVEADTVEADAAYTIENNVACAALTADCLPILLSDKYGECVAAVHAGWRGVINGVIQNTITAMSEYVKPDYAWLGPAIGPQAFEVGADVYQQYLHCDKSFSQCFTQQDSAKWKLNIYQAAKQVLNSAEIMHIYGGDFCTYSDADQFFSFRRQATTGRMATFIYKR